MQTSGQKFCVWPIQPPKPPPYVDLSYSLYYVTWLRQNIRAVFFMGVSRNYARWVRHSLKCKTTEQAAIFGTLRVRSSWFWKNKILKHILLFSCWHVCCVDSPHVFSPQLQLSWAAFVSQPGRGPVLCPAGTSLLHLERVPAETGYSWLWTTQHLTAPSDYRHSKHANRWDLKRTSLKHRRCHPKATFVWLSMLLECWDVFLMSNGKSI